MVVNRLFFDSRNCDWAIPIDPIRVE